MKQQFQLQVEAPHFMDAFTNIRDIAKGSPELSPDHSTTGKKFLVSTGTCTEQLDSGTEGVRDGRIEEPVIGEEEEENGMGKELMTCVSHGSITVMGRRRVMEDTVMVVPAALSLGLYSYDFFAVYDGHGGSIVAELCRDRMHKLLSRAMDACKGGPEGGKGVTEVNWSKLMTTCFEKMDEEVGRSTGATEVDDRPHPSSERKVGCTAVVAVVGKEEIVVANCGDSRAVLCRGDDAVPLSRDHKPDRPDERERIEAAGGRIINWRGSRVLGVLGDHYLRPYVIPEPEVTASKRTESDSFLVIASDGLWDVVSNEVACRVVKRSLDGSMRWSSEEEPKGSKVGEAAAVLIQLAMARGSNDNISVIVVELNKSSNNSC